MNQFIDLKRQFRDLTDSELEDPELLASLNDHGLGSSIDWEGLLRYKRVVLLAEAGAGKTREMQERVEQISEAGGFAFFLPLESLDRDDLIYSLSPEEQKRFETWKSDGEAPAHFFLDAVDELKLTDGKLDRALLRFSKSIGQNLDRAWIIVSCRPYDWRANLDLATVEKRLPIPNTVKVPSVCAEEAFLEALRHDRGKSASELEHADGGENLNSVRTVVLLPMSDSQIEFFAQNSGIEDASAFLAEIRKRDAWTFARRPLDLAELIATWIDAGKLGTRAEQHEANVVSKLKDNPDRPGRDVLSEERARIGAERLALALALTRTRTLKSPEQAIDIQRAEGVLDPSTILEDWTEQERQTLLRRALFDPATYGRVRFHHRSVQEYLAARHLKRLRDSGMSIKAMFRLLFAEQYGVKVVFPSMRAIAAWLALWDSDVRQELMSREPEALLSLGDPESLTIGARSQLLTAFANAYGTGGWRGLNIPIDEVRRLSHPELGPTVRKLWGDGAKNTDVQELLIEVIWQGPIEMCADLAHTAALDIGNEDYHRIIAIRALIASGKNEIVRELAQKILADPKDWPDKVVHGIACDLFPTFINVDEMMTLIERTREPKRSVGGFSWALREVAERLEPSSGTAIEFRDQLANLIWRERNAKQQFHHISGRFDYLAPALAVLCDRQLSLPNPVNDAGLIRACVIASRFGRGESGLREPVGKMRSQFKENHGLRSVAFWVELDFMDEVVPAKDDWHRRYHAEHDSLIGHLTSDDRSWLETALKDETSPQRRAVALHALIDQLQQRGALGEEKDAISGMLKCDAALEAILSERTAAPKRNKELETSIRKLDESKRKSRAKEAQRLRDWQSWRREMLVDPAEAFGAEKQAHTISNLYSWLSAAGKSRFNVWDKPALTLAFGSDIADRAEAAFRACWRNTHPQLWSARPSEERNSTPYAWIFGLCGLSAEAATPGWSRALSSSEARLATAYATLELDGFSPFISGLLASHPAEVEAVIGDELDAEFEIAGDNPQMPTLQDLAYSSEGLKRLLLPRIMAILARWPTASTPEAAIGWAQKLDQVLTIVAQVAGDADREVAARQCVTCFLAEPVNSAALIWLKGLFLLDAAKAAQVFEDSLTCVDGSNIQSYVIAAFSELFGDRGSALVEIKNLAQRAQVLGRLVRSAYAFVRREDDQVHEGAYSPDTRDRAERARDLLLSALIDTPGPEARRVVLELAAEPDFAHLPDRLKLLARHRAATDAEFSPYDARAIATLETKYEVPPNDRDGLFAVMLDRLEDLGHDIGHHDFSDRRTLRSITEEVEMQRTLALRLESKSNGAYVVSREDEVADQKRTDIRFCAVRGDQKAVAEVKLADQRWSLAELESALREQLVGQYLRHITCKAGCLLLTYDGNKKYWKNPSTRQRMNFFQMINHLNEKAKILEEGALGDIRLAVCGLDLTDPPLEKVQR